MYIVILEPSVELSEVVSGDVYHICPHTLIGRLKWTSAITRLTALEPYV